MVKRSNLRVISGRAKGRRLKRVPGDVTRPIMDRVKENLFNIIGSDVAGTHWLDLFAGTGQVAIEALSRGARSAVFVESDRRAVQIIRWNLEHTALGVSARIIHGDAFVYLRDGTPEPKFDTIYVAPPQYRGLWSKALLQIDDRSNLWLSPTGNVVIQIDPKEAQELSLRHLLLADERRYGNTMLGFYNLASG